MIERRFNVVDLFCGLGGLSVGVLESCIENNVELRVCLAADNNQDAANFYKKNFDNYLNHFFQEDIKELLEYVDPIKLGFNEIDMLLAGPPCQGHSNLNNNTRRKDPRNELYLETIFFIKKYKPNNFLIENVPSIIHSSEKVVDYALTQLKNAGYHVETLNVDFSKLGVAQKRKRHILFGSLVYERLARDTLVDAYDKINPKTVNDAIGDLVTIDRKIPFDIPSKMSADNIQRAEYLIRTDTYDLPNDLRPRCHQKKHSYKSMYGRLHWNKPAQTITGGFGSMGQGRFLHPNEPRVLTPHEAARIQGLPDWLDFSAVTTRSSMQKIIGNAVPPILSKVLSNAIIKGLIHEKESTRKEPR